MHRHTLVASDGAENACHRGTTTTRNTDPGSEADTAITETGRQAGAKTGGKTQACTCGKGKDSTEEYRETSQPCKKPAKTRPVDSDPARPKITVHQKAEQTDLLALKDNLADMRQGMTASNLKKTSRLSQSGGQTSKIKRAELTSGTTRSSGGIQTSGLSRNTGGGELASHKTTQVHSPAGNASSRAGSASNNRGERTAGRSIEEIQMVYDRNKGAIYSVYNRALRKDPTLQGKVVLQLTIAPSGKVISCKLISSELNDPALGQKITQRVKLFKFELKDVSEVTITYPIDFLPA